MIVKIQQWVLFPSQGTDTVVPLQVVTTPLVILEGIQLSQGGMVSYPVVVNFLSSQVVATESLVMAHT